MTIPPTVASTLSPTPPGLRTSPRAARTGGRPVARLGRGHRRHPICDYPVADYPVADNPVAQVAAALRSGAILAIKGIGGYHLAVDATSPRAVAELRRRKSRTTSPLP